MRLYTHARNSAGDRVRIALRLKGLVASFTDAMALPRDEWLALNPQGLMPALEVDRRVIPQATAILEYIEERWPDPPLLPPDPVRRAEARGFALHIAAELHPLNVQRVRRRLAEAHGQDAAGVARWTAHWTALSYAALEAMLRGRSEAWPFCYGDAPGWADLHLVPQIRVTRRLGLDLSPYPLLLAVATRCEALPAFDPAPPAFG